MGVLNQARKAHGVFFNQNNREFIVVGGYGLAKSTERCELHTNSINCTLVSPVLDKLSDYPELMRVSHDYCPK